MGANDIFDVYCGFGEGAEGARMKADGTLDALNRK